MPTGDHPITLTGQGQDQPGRGRASAKGSDGAGHRPALMEGLPGGLLREFLQFGQPQGGMRDLELQASVLCFRVPPE